MTRAELETWIAAYERAWRTDGTEPLAELFTDDVEYVPKPFADPIRGLGALAEFWEAEREGAGEPFEFGSSPIAVEGSVGVARIEVRYLDPEQRYLDLWIVELGENGRCRRFEEWPFWPERPRSAR